jgi:hypothetical protein
MNPVQRLKAAGIRLQRVSNNRFRIIWRRHQLTVDDLTLLEAALFIDRAIQDMPQNSQQLGDEMLARWQAARAAGIAAAQRLEDRA